MRGQVRSTNGRDEIFTDLGTAFPVVLQDVSQHVAVTAQLTPHRSNTRVKQCLQVWMRHTKFDPYVLHLDVPLNDLRKFVKQLSQAKDSQTKGVTTK